MRTLLLAALTTGIVGTGLACERYTNDEPGAGVLGGVCFPNGTCGADLACLEGRCLPGGVDAAGPVSAIEAGVAVDGGANDAGGSESGPGCGAYRCAFVVHGEVQGNFGSANGGLRDGSARCTSAAHQAGLRGDYVAIATADGEFPTLSGGGWALPSGALVIAPGAPFHPLRTPLDEDEFGQRIPEGTLLWTGLDAVTTKELSSCGGFRFSRPDYSGTVGTPRNTTGAWYTGESRPCSETHSVACFQR